MNWFVCHLILSKKLNLHIEAKKQANVEIYLKFTICMKICQQTESGHSVPLKAQYDKYLTTL